ncbi:hypothetical protein QTP88_006395 [Uroleucon formosanum]
MIPISLTSYPTGVRLVASPVENFNKPKKERPIIFPNRFIGGAVGFPYGPFTFSFFPFLFSLTLFRPILNHQDQLPTNPMPILVFVMVTLSSIDSTMGSFSACVSDYKRPPGKIVLIMPTKLAHRLAPRLGNTSFMGFLSEQIKQIGPIKISCWQISVKEIRFDYTKKEISYALENDNYVKSKVILSE